MPVSMEFIFRELIDFVGPPTHGVQKPHILPTHRCCSLALCCRPQGRADDNTPIIEVYYKRSDKKAHVDMYVQAFSKLHSRGLIKRDKVIRVL